MTDFEERHTLMTDGPHDGGLDAYYIDADKKKLYLIQAKFRTSQGNFEEKAIGAEDLVKMDLQRILRGEEVDSDGNKFNSKVRRFQREWGGVTDQANYRFLVVILGNLKKYNDRQIRQLIDNSDYDVFDYARTYQELVFPVCSGTYYEPKEITIAINLSGKDQPILKQEITTKYGRYDVRILFVPAQEIGRILSKYKNSVLQTNPRNYLSLSKNPVNQEIQYSILGTSTNEFAILNNGITMIADYFTSTETTGKKDVGQVIIRNPQIINGGQTACTLSEIFQDKDMRKKFAGKEVLLKAVIVTQDNESGNGEFTEAISNATNQQTKVSEADRRSNDEVQLKIQKLLFENFGHFYERKSGEFYPGMKDGYIRNGSVIDRIRFIRAYHAFMGNPADARRSGEDRLFRSDHFRQILGCSQDFRKMLFAYRIGQHLRTIGRKRKTADWGSGLRYGKMAVIAAVGATGLEENIGPQNIDSLVVAKVNEIHKKWEDFEHWAKKQKRNAEYHPPAGGFDFDNYYKGKTLNQDIKRFFGKERK